MAAEPLVLKAKASSDAKTLGAAVALNVIEGKAVSVLAVGASAVSQAVKAGAIASGLVAVRGIRLAFIPGFTDVVGHSGDTITAINLKVIEV